MFLEGKVGHPFLEGKVGHPFLEGKVGQVVHFLVQVTLLYLIPRF
jgi:hypothetical protein